MKLYPYLLSSVLKSPIWGGTRLVQEWGKHTENDTVGESWELTVREDAVSHICNGCYSGKTVRDLISEDQNAIMGKSSYVDGVFPLLVKLIDAGDRLSVQVHPDDAYAARVEADRGKTEVWYIVEADEGAEIICGLAEGITVEDFAVAIREGRSVEALHHQPVCAGETYFIPSGLPHAIGKGILIAEIQQNCDLTYRVYDYERRQKDGTLRELHVQKALDVIRNFGKEEIEALRYARAERGLATDSVLVDCAYFRTERLELTGEEDVPIGGDGYLKHLLCLSGHATLRYGADVVEIGKGDSYLLPAALSELSLEGKGIFLLSSAY